MYTYVTTILINIRLICNNKKLKICGHVFEVRKMLNHKSNEQNLAGRQLTENFCLIERCSDKNAFTKIFHFHTEALRKKFRGGNTTKAGPRIFRKPLFF